MRRSAVADALASRWDVSDRRSTSVGCAERPSTVRLLAFGARFTSVLRTDNDGLPWLEAHPYHLAYCLYD